MSAVLDALDDEERPFVDASAISERDVTWARPALVAQVGFSAWTRAGRRRHPRLLGLRDDEPARAVVREE